jgi:hypothetical protein
MEKRKSDRRQLSLDDCFALRPQWRELPEENQTEVLRLLVQMLLEYVAAKEARRD